MRLEGVRSTRILVYARTALEGGWMDANDDDE
jgi:hypothetical protein